MGFILTVEGSETLHYGKDVIRSVHTGLSSPADSRAKATNNCATILINGKLNVGEVAEGDSETLKLFQWGKVAAGQDDVYRSVTVEVEANNQCFRKIKFTKAFVVEYNERYNDSAGVGEFAMVIRQKADKIEEIEVDGGMSLGDSGAGGAEQGAPEGMEAASPQGAGSAAGASASAGAAVGGAAQSAAMQKPLMGNMAQGFVGAGGNKLQKTLENAGRAAVESAAQKMLNKADPTGTASAAAGAAMQGDLLGQGKQQVAAAMGEAVQKKMDGVAQQAMKTASAETLSKGPDAEKFMKFMK